MLDVRAGRLVPIAGIVVEADRISAVLPSGAQLPDEGRRVDLAGTTLVPGLADLRAIAAPTPTADADFFYAMALAYGVTTLRVVDAPTAWAIGQRNRARSGETLAPALWVAGPALAPAGTPGAGVRPVASSAAVRREVGGQAQLGVDFVRADPSAPLDMVRAIVAAARAEKVRTSAEPGASTAIELARAGVTLVDRLAYLSWTTEADRPAAASPPPAIDADVAADSAWERVSERDITSFSAALSRTRTALLPLLAGNRAALSAEALEKDPAVALLPARWRDDLLRRAFPSRSPEAARADKAAAVRAGVVARLVKDGVRVATGVDATGGGYGIPGAGVHRELALLVGAGLTPAEAIRAATVTSAEVLGAAGSIGQLRPGFRADFFAVDGDPLQRLDDLARIRLIVRGGEVLDRDDLLKQAKRARR